MANIFIIPKELSWFTLSKNNFFGSLNDKLKKNIKNWPTKTFTSIRTVLSAKQVMATLLRIPKELPRLTFWKRGYIIIGVYKLSHELKKKRPTNIYFIIIEIETFRISPEIVTFQTGL